MAEERHLRVEQSDGTAHVRFLVSRLEAEMAISSLGDELKEIAAQPECVKLILDFSAVEHITSAMLGKLVSTNRRMREKGGKMVLCGIHENLRVIFRVTRLEDILDIRETESDAFAA